MKTDIKSMTAEEREAVVVGMGYPPFRARQIGDFLRSGVTSFEAMHTLPKALRERLEKDCRIPCVTVVKRYESKLDDTVKYLFALPDGAMIESVLMHYRHGWSQCVSTQVGCRMGCRFCATGTDGLTRDLLPSEILSQIEVAQKDRGVRVGSVVLMGMGEPLDNYDHVMRFLELVAGPGDVEIGARHITLSTCGLVDRIDALMKRGWQGTLSVSLHAPNDRIRREMMPVANKWPIGELLAKCREYAAQTGRRVTFEYAMIDGKNDSDACADELIERLSGMLCHVNLIPVNEVAGKDQKRSGSKRLNAFAKRLQDAGIPATVRRTLGADIEASCGQLRQRELQK